MRDEPTKTSSSNQAVDAKMVKVEERLQEVVGSALFENQILSVNISVPSPYDIFDEVEAAAYLKLPVDSVRHYAKRNGELAFCNFGKGRRRYLRKDLEAFLERRREPSIYEQVKARPRRKGVEK
jgi:hypothetical protein